MATYTDEDCGIVEPHIHTGDLHEQYAVRYFCNMQRGWIEEKSCDTCGPHLKARTESVTYEIIQIIPDSQKLFYI